jgi:hypothetical protein
VDVEAVVVLEEEKEEKEEKEEQERIVEWSIITSAHRYLCCGR